VHFIQRVQVTDARGRARPAQPSRPKEVTISKWQGGFFAVAQEIAVAKLSQGRH